MVARRALVIGLCAALFQWGTVVAAAAPDDPATPKSAKAAPKSKKKKPAEAPKKADAPPKREDKPESPPSSESAVPADAVVITEVLYNVPAGMDGDANADGERDPIGDEFVELYNRSEKSVSLRGWTIANRLQADDEEAKRGVRFTFPSFDLPPGGVVVVFNGHESRIAGPVGDDRKAPTSPSDTFGGAWVFSMRNENRFNAFNNAADFVLLSNKSGTPLDCVVWGKPDTDPPERVRRVVKTKAGDPKGSVARDPEEEDVIVHRKIDGKPCSPGVIPSHDKEREPKDDR
ncbi:MAG TPA: lamin tail domain-containing protein [Phycisphaerales bacterium]|nr:lamin tail domain-containing protein [Phycisphaerales bacterium]